MTTQFVALRPKTYSCVIVEGYPRKVQKLRKPKLRDYKNCQEANETESEINH